MQSLNLIQNIVCNKITISENEHTPYIIDCIRSPITRAFKGALSNVPPEILLSQVLQKLLENNSEIPKEIIDDIIIGNALGNGCGFLNGRAAQILCKLPENIPLYTLNRLCNSGLQAIVNAHNSIKAGNADVIIAGGIESMSFNDFSKMLNKNILNKNVLDENIILNNLLLPMGITNENIVNKYNITRKEQDEFAYNSQKKSTNANKNGIFNTEKIPIIYNNKTIVNDDCIREGTTFEKLYKLKPSFIKNGSTTAGNSSPLSDGCALCLLCSKKIIDKYNIKEKIRGKIINYVSIGVPTELMGIGPSVAIPILLTKSNMKIEDIDYFEINEAFAGQAIYCINKLKIPSDKVNVNGGAIAIGHPLGCTGARLIVSILNILERNKKRLGIVSMCVGTGMGCAALIENMRINTK